MKATRELRGLSSIELQGRLKELYKELLKHKVTAATGANSGNPGKIRQTKKNIARVYTLSRENSIRENLQINPSANSHHHKSHKEAKQ